MTGYYIGLMSGTSMDGIDAVLAEFHDSSIEVLATLGRQYPDTLRHALRNAAATPSDEAFDNLGSLDRQVGACFRDAAIDLIEAGGIEASRIRAIGSHGQTVRHQPHGPHPYSLQIGNPDLIAQGTGIVTVADFRSADIAAGGQGAPLVPPFHEWLFGGSGNDRVILNIGGIANITILRADGSSVTGFDTGPGNTLLDQWIWQHRKEPFDREGAWSASGNCAQELLNELLSFDYFRLPPPKSTGLEEFNLEWLAGHDIRRIVPSDMQATLAELTARSIADAVREQAPRATELFVCGGGAHNSDLLQRLCRCLPDMTIDTTAAVGLHPDWVEGAAFAWLAMRTINKQTGNLPSVTGARRKVVLGAIHYP